MTGTEKSKLQKEIVDVIPPGKSGRLILAPRVGKTKMIIDIIKRDKLQKILWVTPTTKLAEEDIPNEFVVWGAKKYTKKLETVTWMSLHLCKGTYDLIVLDEEQFMTTLNSEPLLKDRLRANVILSMTGTESKSDVKQELYSRLGLKVLYKLTINQAVDVGLLSNYAINVVKVPLSDKLNIEVKYKDKTTKQEKSFMTSELKQYQYISTKMATTPSKTVALHRRRVISKSPSKLSVARYIFNSLEGKRLIFAVDRSQAEELCDDFYHGTSNTTALEKFKSGEINKIAMVNKGGTGYTYTVIDGLILVQVDSDTNGLTSQKIARTLLEQGDYKATIWLICLECTQDEVWIKSTLESFDESKVTYINFKDLLL